MAARKITPKPSPTVPGAGQVEHSIEESLKAYTNKFEQVMNAVAILSQTQAQMQAQMEQYVSQAAHGPQPADNDLTAKVNMLSGRSYSFDDLMKVGNLFHERGAAGVNANANDVVNWILESIISDRKI